MRRVVEDFRRRKSHFAPPGPTFPAPRGDRPGPTIRTPRLEE
jgi:hypothetical protein